MASLGSYPTSPPTLLAAKLAEILDSPPRLPVDAATLQHLGKIDGPLGGDREQS